MLNSPSAKDWIIDEIYRKYQVFVRDPQVNAAYASVRNQVRKNNNEKTVHRRYATLYGTHYLDLCNDKGEVVSINENGWHLENGNNILFYRPRGMGEIPRPAKTEHSPYELFKFLNIQDQGDMISFLAWVTSLLRYDIQHPILTLTGMPGSAKTTCARFIRMLFDPSTPLEVDVPGKEDELALAFLHNPLPFFDNMSRLNGARSDMFCKAVTGGSYSKRLLYSDFDQVHMTYKKPIITTSLEVPSDRADYHRRMLHIELPHIKNNCVRSERELMDSFERARPELLGSLLNLTMAAMGKLPNIRLNTSSSLLDFDVWGAAISKVLQYDQEIFIQSRIQDVALDDHTSNKWFSLAEAVKHFAQQSPGWKGTMTELYNQLKQMWDGSSEWPKNPVGLGRLRKTINGILQYEDVQIVEAGRKNNVAIYQFETSDEKMPEDANGESENTEVDTPVAVIPPDDVIDEYLSGGRNEFFDDEDVLDAMMAAAKALSFRSCNVESQNFKSSTDGNLSEHQFPKPPPVWNPGDPEQDDDDEEYEYKSVF